MGVGFVGWDCRVCCCCWPERWSFLDIWGLGFAGNLVLAFARNFTFWNFFLFFKLLTCCGIQNFFDYGFVREWMSWVLCWVSILWMVWFGCCFMWVSCVCSCWCSLIWWCSCFFFFFSCWFDVHVLWCSCSLTLDLLFDSGFDVVPGFISWFKKNITEQVRMFLDL